MSDILTTSRLGLRNWRSSDIDPFYKMNSDPEVMEYFPSLLSRKENGVMVERFKSHIETFGFGFFAVDRLDTGEFIGFIGISTTRFRSHFTPCIEIGWRLSKDHWNNGFATEGARACLRYGFEELMMNEIFSFTPLQNGPSERVMQKIGMKKIGEFEHPLLDKNHDLSWHVLYHLASQI